MNLMPKLNLEKKENPKQRETDSCVPLHTKADAEGK